MFPMLGFAFAAMVMLAAQTSAMASDRIRLAVKRTGLATGCCYYRSVLHGFSPMFWSRARTRPTRRRSSQL